MKNKRKNKNTSELVYVEKAGTINQDDSFIFVTKFDDDAVSNFFKSFSKMHQDDTIKIIPIVISSFGGQVYSLLPMLDLIATSKKPVATMCLGKAMSCGAVLLAAGTKGYRFVSPSSMVMIHEVASFSYGKITEINHDSKHTGHLNDLLFSRLDSYAGKKKNFFKNEVKKRANLDWFLDAKKAMSYGLVDHVHVPSLFKKIT